MLLKRALICEGRGKRLFETDDPELCVMEFKDEAIAFGGLKRQMISGKGVYCCRMCAAMFRLLEANGVPTHFVRRIGAREVLVRRGEMLKVCAVVRHMAAGDLCRRLGVPSAMPLREPVFEYRLKDAVLDHPLINESHVTMLNMATEQELETVRALSLKAAAVLRAYLSSVRIELVDIRFEFARIGGRLVLADEVTPDICRLWDTKTRETLDLDNFRYDLGDASTGYKEVLARILEKDATDPDEGVDLND